jgi:hypothetical protein
MASDAVTDEPIDEPTTDPDTAGDDAADPGDAGTPADHEDEDLQSPPLNIDELPAY